MEHSASARPLGRAALLAVGALVVGAAACSLDPKIAAPFTATGTGDVTGQVFFDSNGNGLFDPVAGDTIIRSATIAVAQRGDSTKVVSTGTPQTDGSFVIPAVPVGSYDLRAFVTGTGAPVTCSPVLVTVYQNERAFASTPVRISCRIDVVEAEKRPNGATITVGGIVTAAPGVYRPANLYLQDVTGGTQAFNVPGGTSSGIVEGDSIEATGVLTLFSGEYELSPTTSFRIVTRGHPVDAREYRVKALSDSLAANSFRAKPIGELVVVRNAKVRGFKAPTTTGTDGFIVQGTDSIALRLDQAAQARVPTALFDPAKCYDVTGILGAFSPIIQFKPRNPSDVVEVSCSTP